MNEVLKAPSPTAKMEGREGMEPQMPQKAWLTGEGP
jgi:hypothetical protein